MSRSRTPADTETAVLMLSRRRCALCYGLHETVEVSEGQIAHVNRNANDSRLENLAFLCLLHHDQYDARRSQSKGFTEAELRQYRARLYAHFDREKPPVSPGNDSFSEFLDLVPVKWRHVLEEALEFLTRPHRTQSVVLVTLDGPRSLESIAEQIPPNDVEWTATIIQEAVDKRWLHQLDDHTQGYEATVRARVLIEALGDLPQAVKDAAVKKIWSLN